MEVPLTSRIMKATSVSHVLLNRLFQWSIAKRAKCAAAHKFVNTGDNGAASFIVNTGDDAQCAKSAAGHKFVNTGDDAHGAKSAAGEVQKCE